MDDLDRKIIRALNQNARKSYREVAKEVDSSVTAVIHRIKKFEEAGVLKGFIPVVDMESFGKNIVAVIALRISQGKLIETQKKIAEDDRVAAVYDVTGEWDSFVIAYFEDRQDLNNFIKTLLSHKNVDRSVTHMVLNVVKEERRILV
ncbi:MAG: Lrp/AsnC family transcriptional regulator [Acidobacteria bacterium]|nr:Lrp/AsnC family transcriptional regulator [Acidobacteriota bacterium]MCG2815529.1 Lrp/AsnC family transcriptional regulator [Candidatus Aminicenantes bacterium]MBU4203293.1 Lrp/AsnC family transcriptional regulator [Acidobacteriota bacterium]MBU4253477.1 Lrp/AsnC family transcriptional regulator [Acidobacteriota bacterium]MBU4329287.1 Lrp/AsnC family transcriptional regulator [Acidobacteriota bacterium]